EQFLHLSYSRYRNDAREIEPSMFIAELQEKNEMPTSQVFVEPDTVAVFQALALTGEVKPEIAHIEKDFINVVLDRFVMNVTALNNYLKCPLEFYFKNLIRIPSPKNENTEFGSAAHHAIQLLFDKMKANGDKFPSRVEFIEDFQRYMQRHRESFTKEQFARRMEYGVEVLANYYDKYIGQWSKTVLAELNIKNVSVENVPLKGKLDKLEFDGKSVNVVDYKTGDVANAIKKLKGPAGDDLTGGDYWRQAVFYKILVDNYGNKDWRVVSTEFDFIEPDKKKQYQKKKVVINPEDIGIVTRQITETWQKIQDHDFYTGCGKEDCHWCEFVKSNKLAALPEEEEA
ncbi:MAG: PD-(D/E)XK nuclease family protein, partial [Flavitalea sp.]